jgi:hypothetical protein
MDMVGDYLNATINLSLPFYMISVFFTITLYMFSKLLSSQKLEKIAKLNGSELITTTLLFLFVPFTLHSLYTAFSSLTPGNQGLMTYALMRAKVWWWMLFNDYSQLFITESSIAVFSSVAFNPVISSFNIIRHKFPVVLPEIHIAPFAGLGIIAESQITIASYLNKIMFVIAGRYMMLEFIKKYMVIFLALGLAFRAFTFTRRTGTGLIAVSLTALLVYPLTTLLTDYLLFHVYVKDSQSLPTTVFKMCANEEEAKDLITLYQTKQQHFAQDISAFDIGQNVGQTLLTMFKTLVFAYINVFTSLVTLIEEGLKNVWYSMIGVQTKPWSIILRDLVMNVFTSPAAFATFFDALLTQIRALFELPILMFFAFVVEIVLTITTYRSIALALDTELDIFGLMKLV